MNILKIAMFMFSIMIGLFYSCEESAKNVENKNMSDKEVMQLLMTPDSLRSAEDKVLLQQLEAVLYEDCIIENGKFVITISKEKLEERGIPEVVFDVMLKEVGTLNNFLDTTSFSKQLFLESYLKSQKEYFEKKKL